MKTRFSSLVNIKKNKMQNSEEVVQKANKDVASASEALERSYATLQNITAPDSGSVKELLASRSLVSSARNAIKHNQEWIKFSQNQLLQAQEQLKLDMVEYEKFKYLEVDEVKKILKQKKLQEAKDLDEVALMTYNIKGHQ